MEDSSIHEILCSMLDTAFSDLKAAEVLLKNRLELQALYFIEQASEKATKVAHISWCLCLREIAEDVTKCYENVLGYPKECNLVDAVNAFFIREVGHRPLKLYSFMLDRVAESYKSMAASIPGFPEILGELNIPTSATDFLLNVAQGAEKIALKACSNLPKTSTLCRLVDRLREARENYIETGDEKARSELLKTITEVFEWIPLLIYMRIPNVDLGEIIKEITERGGAPSIEIIKTALLRLIDHVINNLISANKNTLVSKDSIIQSLLPTLEQILECIRKVLSSLTVAYFWFYLTSPLYNVVRYPIVPERFKLCEDRVLVEYSNFLKELCSKPVINPKSIVIGSCSLRKLIKDALYSLENTIQNLEQILEKANVHRS